MPGHSSASFCVFLRRNPPQTPHTRTTTRCWHHTAQCDSLGVHRGHLGSRLQLGEAEMGPGHRQNGGQQQERHLDASGGHFSKEQAPSWLGAGVWELEGDWEGGGYSVGSVGAPSGEFLRLWSRCRHRTWAHLGGTSVGRGAPSWLVLWCGS